MGIHPNPEQPDGISLPPGTILGYRADGRPIHIIAGGAEDTDDGPDADVEVDDAPDDADADTADTDDDTEPDEKPKPKPPAKKAVEDAEEEWKPPTRDEWDRVRRTMAKRKQEKLDVQKQLNELRDKHREQETDAEKAVREAAEKAEARYKPIIVNKAARAALIQAGATAAIEGDKEKTEARLSRLLKLIDVSDLSVEDDGEVLGLDEQIEGLRSDYPELFEAREKRPKARPTGAPRPAVKEKPRSTAELHAAKLLGRA